MFGITKKANGTHAYIQRPGFFSGKLTDPSLGKAPGDFHLEEPVLGGDKAVSHHGVIPVLGVDVSHALFIPHHLYGVTQAGQLQFAAVLIIVQKRAAP